VEGHLTQRHELDRMALVARATVYGPVAQRSALADPRCAGAARTASTAGLDHEYLQL
jgi:hypothetical protein